MAKFEPRESGAGYSVERVAESQKAPCKGFLGYPATDIGMYSSSSLVWAREMANRVRREIIGYVNSGRDIEAAERLFILMRTIIESHGSSEPARALLLASETPDLEGSPITYIQEIFNMVRNSPSCKKGIQEYIGEKRKAIKRRILITTMDEALDTKSLACHNILVALW